MINLNRVRLDTVLIAALVLSVTLNARLAAQDLERQPEPFCTEFVPRSASLLRGLTVSAQVSNHGTLSSPRNDSTDVRWRGLGYGYEFGIIVGAEVPVDGPRDLAVPKRDRFGRIARDETGDTLWVQRIVSDGLLSHGGERSPDRREWWGWHPVECAGAPVRGGEACFANATIDHTFVMNDLRNREFAYYPLQGDSTWQGIGLQVESRVVQSDDPALEDVLFLIHRVENRSRVDLDHVVLGMWGDPHVGGARNFQDDLARFVPDLGLVEVWDADGVADSPGVPPGYFGYQFLEGGPGLSSVTATPFSDLSPSDDVQLWDLLQPGRFDSMPMRPGDDVYILGSGPVELRVGESVRFAVALLLAPSSAALASTAERALATFRQECPPLEVAEERDMVPVPGRDAGKRIDPIVPPSDVISADCPQQCGCDDPVTVCDETVASCAWMGGPTLNPFVVTPSRIRESLMDAPASVSVVRGETFVKDAGRSPAATLRHTLGVDVAQIGANRYHLATRGFNQSTAGNNLLLVDYREGAVPGLGFNSYALLPVASIDVAQAEVVRGTVSSRYGSRADHGAIQFLTKEPFDYPGTSVSASAGENNFFEGAIRHAQKLSSRFAYKVVGSYGQADDLVFADDDEALAQSVESQSETMSQGFVRGTLQYRHIPCACLTVTGNVDYAGTKQNLLHETGEMFMDYRLGAGQIKVETDNLMAQTYYMNGDTREAYDYRTGLPIIDESEFLAAQIRYKTSLFEDIQSFVLGLDYDRTNPETGGTLTINQIRSFELQSASTSFVGKSPPPLEAPYPIHLGRHGINEDDDTIEDIGAYIQSRTKLTPELELQIAGRLDFSNVIDAQLSPKLGLAFRPSSSHAFRFSLGRGFASPTSIQLFADFPAGGTPLVPIQIRRNLDGWTFDSQPRSISILPSSFGLQERGIGIDLERAFSAATDSLFTQGGLLEGWDALEFFLRERAGSMSGLSEGVLRYDGDPESRTVSNPEDVQELRPMDTRSIEIGYKGNFKNRTFLGVDLFYAKTKNHISGLRPITPFVFVPNVGEDLTEVILDSFTDDELARYKLSRNDLVYLYSTVAASLAERPVGLVVPVEDAGVQSGPRQLYTWLNHGDADYMGIDFEVRRAVNPHFSYYGIVSWMRGSYFDEENLGEAEPGLAISLNAPRFKFGAGAERTFFESLRLSVAGRYVDGFEVFSGVHTGEIDDYLLLDIGLGLAADAMAPGLRLDVMAENLLDEEHVEWPGAPRVGRYVTARLSYAIVP